MHAIDLIWTGTAVVIASFVVAFAAETAQFLVSQGVALAILAWLQTLPEFAVEAVITWRAGKDPSQMHLITANFTGSLRLLVGFGWPLVYFISFMAYGFRENGLKHKIVFRDDHAIEIVFLLIGTLLWLIFVFTGVLSIFTGALLVILYILYLWILIKLPPEENVEEANFIVRYILTKTGREAGWVVLILFLTGGAGILFVAEPFLKSMLKVAVALGLSEFYFVQWLAPFLSEFPEKLSAFNWARSKNHTVMGVVNLISSTVNQTTLLVGILPFLFALSRGSIFPIHFDASQIFEIKLTVAQLVVGLVILLDMEFSLLDAFLMLFLWTVQFFFPSFRVEVFYAFVLWTAIEMIKLTAGGFKGIRALTKIWTLHVKSHR